MSRIRYCRGHEPLVHTAAARCLHAAAGSARAAQGVALCRCGANRKMPYRDGSQAEADFEAD